MIKDGYFGCEDFLHRLPVFLDGEHDPADDRLLREHLDRCQGCLAKYRFERNLLESIRSVLTAVRVPDSLAARVAAIVAQAGAPPTESGDPS